MHRRPLSAALLARSTAALLLTASVQLSCTASTLREDAGTIEDSATRDAGGDVLDAGRDAGDGTDTGTDAGDDTDAGSDLDAGIAVGPPCEKTQGVCAGAAHARLEDGGFEPTCTALSYGSDYEPAETRCDGLDNDCDGETDRHWATLFPRSEGSTWNVPVARMDGGYVALAQERDGGFSLRRFDDQLEALAEPEPLKPAGTGYLDGPALLNTAQGIALTYERRGQQDVTDFYVPLSAEGLLLRGNDGEPFYSSLNTTPGFPYGSLRTAPSFDGSKVLVSFHETDAGTPFMAYATEVLGLVTDPLGNIVTPRTSLMRVRVEGAGLFPKSVLGVEDGFVLAVSEWPPELGMAFTLRLQRFSSALAPVGSERTIELLSETDAHLANVPADPGSGGPPQPVLVYRESFADGGSGLFVVRNLFDGGEPEAWNDVAADTAFLRALGTPRGLQVAWKTVTYCPECISPTGIRGTSRGRVFARGEDSGVVDLTPSTADLDFDPYARPGVGLTAGPDGWMTFFLPVLQEGGVELRAVSYCAP
ncbi:hypothetical protein FGE12_28855 [Aggregicoccus sp. 17bor-14]|uniref:hypothetical protein n=1 Tax=Myxococcaceae TaxID=31 RepID=UPI00129C6DA7|nr:MULTISPECIES: hypothetical protein [Myxococcaceae]MBF5046458.1 hypothetical protein [Simulacricoccus sp. 17bor-14]MRI92176.1 hypothetical protein [Aggregicoccus sp. 17bor-14]